MTVLVVVLAGGVLALTATGRGEPSHPISTPIQTHETLPPTDRGSGNLDVLSGGLQVSVHLANGSHRGSVKLAGPGVSAPIAFPDRAMSWRSASAATNPSPMTSRRSSTRGPVRRAPTRTGEQPGGCLALRPRRPWWPSTGVRRYGRKMGSPVGIPPDSGVLGQTGSNLVVVVQGTPAGQPLLLWNPAEQRVVATFGQFQQQVSTPTFVAWTESNVLYADSPEGAGLSSASGPNGDWATALASDPSAAILAVVWAPRPGSPCATSRLVIDRESRLGLIDVATGANRLIDGSRASSVPWPGHRTARACTSVRPLAVPKPSGLPPTSPCPAD